MSISVGVPKNIDIQLIPLTNFETYDRFHWTATVALALAALFGSDYLAKQTVPSGLSALIFMGITIWSIFKIAASKKDMKQSVTSKKFQI